MEAAAPHVRLFTAGLPAAEAPKWYYQDLQGQLQGPFDANTMSRWCGENALPRDLKCLGVQSADSSPLVPSSTTLSAFQPLEKLLENAAAGIQYMPVRLGKGSSSDEGPATPQSAAPPKGSRAPGGPGAPGTNSAQAPAGAAPLSNGGPDVTRGVDQRASLAAAAAAAAAAGGMNGFPAQQQAMQATGLMAHLQQMQQRAAASQSRQQQQTTPQRGAAQPPGPPPNQFPQEQQHAGTQQRQPPGGLGAFMPPMQPPAGGGQDGSGGDEGGELTPNDAAWEPALIKLLKREGFSGKEADVKWRVIVSSGDRVGPFSTDQMVDWMLAGKPPKGVNKQQAQQTAQNPPALQVAGILSSDYNAQRLPGAKFFKPLGNLLALVAAGMQYQAVNKHDLQRGLPNKGWNEGVGPASGAKPVGTTPPLPTGKGASKAAKAAARNSPAGPNSNKQSPQMPGSRSNNQLPGARSRSSTPGGVLDAGEGPAPSTASSSKSSSFKHPMALRQQQRQQEALLAAAGQALPGQPGSQSAAGAAQLGKGLTPPGSRGAAMPGQPGSASRSILTAANSMGPAGLQAAGLAQQQQLAAAQQAAASRLAQQQGMPGPQQQFLTPQQQMQAATMAFMQAQPGAMQAVWLKQQQQMPGQVLAGVYPAGQTLVGYAGGMPGMAMAQAGGHQQGADGGLPRSSSTGSGAQQQQQQQPPPPNASGGMILQQQMGMTAAEAQGWQLQQAAAAAAAAGKIRPQGGGVPAFALGPPGGMPGQPGVSPSHQLMHAAALLFLHDQQQQPQQQQPKPDKPQKQWWVQRNELAFSGPFTGLQMYQAYLQPQGALRLTEGTPIAAVAGSGLGPQQATRDVPPMRAFAPLSCLLEAAAQGFVLVPWPAAAPGVRDNGPSTLLVQQAQSGVTVPLQSVLSQAGLMALQQQQQQPGSTMSDQQGGDGSNEPDGARMGQPGTQQQQQQQMLAEAAKQRQQGSQMLSAVRPAAAGGYVQLPNGQLVPAAGLVPVQGGGLAMLQANPAGVQQPPVVDPLAVANALFTAGGNPHTIVWYIRTDAAAGGEGQQGGSIQGPFDPQEMLNMYRENRLDPSTMLCATHRAAPGQQQIAPPPETFKPLHALMHTVSTPGNGMHGQQAAASVPGTPAAGAGGMVQQQMVPAGMILAQAPGSVGPVLFQVPVSSAGAAPTVLAMPAGALQMQQMGPMSGVPHMAGPVGPYMQTPQGMMAQQHMMAVLAAQQQAQQQQAQQQHAAQQQAQQQHAAAGVGEQGMRQGAADNGPASTGGSSSSAPTAQQLAAAGSGSGGGAAGGVQQQQAGVASGAEAAQRAGAVPPRVDTWGSLAAAQELLQRRPSASSSNGQQTPAAAASAHGMEAALAAAAAAASSRRASVEGHHPQGVSGGMMMLSGGQHMHHHMQQQHHHMQGGPRSTGGGHHHPGGFGGPHHGGPGAHGQPGFGMSGPRSTSSIGRHPQDGAAAAAAAASALAGGLNLQGGSSPSFGQMPQAQQQQLYMQAAMLASMAPQSAAMLQQQQMQMQMQQQQQQAAALAAVSAAQAAPQPAQPQPPPASTAGQPSQEPQPAAASEAPAEA